MVDSRPSKRILYMTYQCAGHIRYVIVPDGGSDLNQHYMHSLRVLTFILLSLYKDLVIFSDSARSLLEATLIVF